MGPSHGAAHANDKSQMKESHKLHKNVQAAISGSGIEYRIHDHGNYTPEIKSPHDFAMALKYSIQRISKTLFLRSRDGHFYAVAVCSINRRVDFRSIANAIGASRLEVASPEELQARTGYPKNGVSPLGLTKDISVAVDSTLFDYPTILIGAGAAAIEIELAPADLVRLSGATAHCITM